MRFFPRRRQPRRRLTRIRPAYSAFYAAAPPSAATVLGPAAPNVRHRAAPVLPPGPASPARAWQGGGKGVVMAAKMSREDPALAAAAPMGDLKEGKFL
jgi:hypothetical protein